ncbi:hypothetical protein QFZ75_002058 [Streptomyces sp. V3I8]|uniref:hypothetical protein n=1 Tax=Streptomyces sp. V3I8 TaxID=3042279 RepID=UPI0027801661|nr:hypothetical protein [Streptomyces sp. V3I8]MDQ1035642.1 hypothetical protein [Streptomyces sp. V3I8]
MNGVQLALHTLHRGERHLATELVAVADRHRAEHEVHHVARDIAAWSREHVRRLAEASAAHGLDLDDPPDGPPDGPPDPTGPIDPPGLSGPPGLLLLRDLRDLHLAATHNSLHWEMLAQVAQATRTAGLLALTASCHPQTLRQMRWTNTMIKNLSPQVLASL